MLRTNVNIIVIIESKLNDDDDKSPSKISGG
jgi:hypothetical protein